MIPYMEKQEESKQTNHQITEQTQADESHNQDKQSRPIPRPIGASQEVFSADPAHGESPPPIDYDLKVVKPVLTPFVLDRYPIVRKEYKLFNLSGLNVSKSLPWVLSVKLLQ